MKEKKERDFSSCSAATTSPGGNRLELQANVIDTTKEIFSTMLMMDVEVDGEITSEGVDLIDNITGMVGFAGTVKGVLALHFARPVAYGVTVNFLGPEIGDDDVDDAIGELANMLGGGVKGMFTDSGRDIDLSLPSIIRGEHYHFQCNKHAKRMVIPFKSDAGTFYVELQLEG